MKMSNTRRLVESALMVALATVLSLFPLAEMPYGGSITFASALPIILVAYRHGIGYGTAAGFVFAVVQQLLGLNNLSYVTTWQSVLAVILLDYIIAFTVYGLGGIFRKVCKKQYTGLLFGSLFCSLLRYICHTISGCTVWAGLSIPDSAALVYSIGYNATYMIPEAIVLALAAVYVGGLVDFRKDEVTRMTDEQMPSGAVLLWDTVRVTAVIAALIADIILIFPHLQDKETGKFTFSGLSEMNYTALIIVSAVALVIFAGAIVTARVMAKKETKNP